MKSSWLLTGAGLSIVTLAGCADPLSRDSTEDLRRSIIEANRREVAAAGDTPDIEVRQPESDSHLEGKPERIEQLDEMSGPEALEDVPIDVGTGLAGDPSQTVAMSLEHAVRIAVRNNLDLQLAYLRPAISETQIVAAEANFDATFFSEVSFQNVDRPQPGTIFGNQPIGSDITKRRLVNLVTGVRQPLETGGQVGISTGFDYTNNNTPGFQQVPDPALQSNLRINIDQPLLRNFGAPVNRAAIMVRRNAHRRDVLEFYSQMLETIFQVERTYWNLFFARRRLAIQQRLLERTIDTRDTLLERARYDVNPVQMAQAQSFVEQRRSEVIRARQELRDINDQLKRLLNSDRFPVAGETLIVPSDDPIEARARYNLLDAVTTALRERPEVRQALLDIDDASIRMAVADNQRLPLLNLNAQIQYSGLDGDLGQSYQELGEAGFIDYIVGGQFELPIGNRRAEAEFRRSRIERRLSVTQYQRVVQQVTLGVKQALRELRTSWELIGANREARRAAAEFLRALIERERTGEALTPEFLLDLKLNAQQRLAEAELREVQSIINYSVAVAALWRNTGTLLERNQIEMTWPEGMFADQPRMFTSGDGEE